MPDDSARIEAPAAAIGDLRIALYHDLVACEAPWRAAAERFPCYAFQCFEWYKTWQDTIGAAEGVTPCIVHIAAPDGATVMLLAFGVYRLGLLRALRPLGVPVTDYFAPLVDPDFAAQLDAGRMAALWNRVLAMLPPVDLVWLRRMPERIEEVANPLALLPRAEHSEDASAALLSATMAEFQTGHTVSWPDTRRRRRRLAECGRVVVEMPQSQAVQQEVLRAVTALKSQQWLRARLRDWFALPGYLDFYRRLTEVPPVGIDIHISCLRVDNQVVAAHWGVVFRGRFYHLITAYDEAWRRYAPGRLLIEDLVAWCISQRTVRVFDFTAGSEPYKREWTDHTMALYGLLAPRSLIGAAYVAYLRLRELIKRQRQVRNLLRRVRGRRPV